MNMLIRKIRRWSKRSKVLAVSDDSLEEWFASLGILDRVKAGNAKCAICGGKVDIASVQIIAQLEGEVTFVCDKPRCMYQFTQEHGRD